MVGEKLRFKNEIANIKNFNKKVYTIYIFLIN